MPVLSTRHYRQSCDDSGSTGAKNLVCNDVACKRIEPEGPIDLDCLLNVRAAITFSLIWRDVRLSHHAATGGQRGRGAMGQESERDATSYELKLCFWYWWYWCTDFPALVSPQMYQTLICVFRFYERHAAFTRTEKTKYVTPPKN